MRGGGETSSTEDSKQPRVIGPARPTDVLGRVITPMEYHPDLLEVLRSAPKSMDPWV